MMPLQSETLGACPLADIIGVVIGPIHRLHKSITQALTLAIFVSQIFKILQRALLQFLIVFLAQTPIKLQDTLLDRISPIRLNIALDKVLCHFCHFNGQIYLQLLH